MTGNSSTGIPSPPLDQNWERSTSRLYIVTLLTRLDEAQAGIKTEGRHINTFKYTDDTTLWEKVKSLLKRVKEESENADLKLHIQKPKDHDI